MVKITVYLLVLMSSVVLGNETKIDDLINTQLGKRHTPSLAVGIISNGKVIYNKARGYSDIENKTLATIHTPYHIASVTKVYTSIAIFHLIEKKQITLHESINQYLPFKVINPHHPEDKITVAELLNHRSGILDNEELYLPYWSIPKGDPKVTLSEFLKSYLVPNEKNYSRKHYEDASRYKVFDYSNTGYALLGLIIESVSGVRLDEYLRKHIFTPLHLSNTGMFLENFESRSVSKTYTLDNGHLIFKGFNGYPDYPAGQLRTSIDDAIIFFTGYLRSSIKPFVLSNKTINLITPMVGDKGEDNAYTWYLKKVNNNWYYHHGGADLGARASVLIDVKNQNAIIAFTNSDTDLDGLVKSIDSIVFNE